MDPLETSAETTVSCRSVRAWWRDPDGQRPRAAQALDGQCRGDRLAAGRGRGPVGRQLLQAERGLTGLRRARRPARPKGCGRRRRQTTHPPPSSRRGRTGPASPAPRAAAVDSPGAGARPDSDRGPAGPAGSSARATRGRRRPRTTVTSGSTPPRPRSGPTETTSRPGPRSSFTSNRRPRTHWSSIVVVAPDAITVDMEQRPRSRADQRRRRLNIEVQRERLVEELEGQAGPRPLAQLLRQRGGQDPPQSLRGRRRHPQVRALRDSDGPGLLAGVDDPGTLRRRSGVRRPGRTSGGSSGAGVSPRRAGAARPAGSPAGLRRVRPGELAGSVCWSSSRSSVSSSCSPIRTSRVRASPRTQRITQEERVRICSESMSIAMSPCAVSSGGFRPALGVDGPAHLDLAAAA